MSMAKNLMQGDQHAIPFVLKMKDGTLITDAMVKTVVLNLGNLSRQYPGDVTYKNGQWLFPVTQAQTFAMRGSVEPQARVEFLNDDIFGGAGEPVELQNALNKGIIGTDGTTAAKQNAPTMQTELQGAILVIVAAAGVEFSAEGAVRYDKTQSLTDAQKQQAKDNIGVVDVPTPSAENVGKIPVSKQVGDGYKYVMEDKSTSDLSLGLAGASTGQSPIINTVDADGKPTAWGAAVLAKVDGSNIPTNAMDDWRTRIAALPGVKVYGKADANGKIKAYTDAACTQEVTYRVPMGISNYGNALLIYDHKTYQCVGFEELASMQGAYLVTVFFRSEIATDSAGAAVLKVETAKLNVMDYLAGSINAPITITAGELPLTATTTT